MNLRNVFASLSMAPDATSPLMRAYEGPNKSKISAGGAQLSVMAAMHVLVGRGRIRPISLNSEKKKLLPSLHWVYLNGNKGRYTAECRS